MAPPSSLFRNSKHFASGSLQGRADSLVIKVSNFSFFSAYWYLGILIMTFNPFELQFSIRKQKRLYLFTDYLPPCREELKYLLNDNCNKIV